MPVIDPQLVAILAIAACALAVVLLVAVGVLARRMRVIRKAQRRTLGPGDDLGEMLDQHRTDVERTREEAARLHAAALDLREQLRGSLSRIAVIRYDAFDDMGGALSFSAALLDDRGHGMVISAINGRSETRCYAKPIVDGLSDHMLSSEEEDAITAAIEGRSVKAAVTTPSAVSSRGGRRRRAS